MIFIAHRGLITGPDIEKENKVATIDFAIKEGFDVEVDLWVLDNKLYFGHDLKDIEKISFEYISERKKSLWIHAKNSEALRLLSMLDEKEGLHFFWHQEDNYTLTSKNIPWIYPGCQAMPTGIIVLPELVMDTNNIKNMTVKGVCSDYIGAIRESHNCGK